MSRTKQKERQAALLRARLQRDLQKFGGELREIPKELWPSKGMSQLTCKPQRVWQSTRFLVVLYETPHEGIARLTVNRVTMKGQTWEDGISWDDLQEIKRLCGFGEYDATEVFPRDRDLVNVASMRHLWIHLTSEVPYKWSRDELAPTIE